MIFSYITTRIHFGKSCTIRTLFHNAKDILKIRTLFKCERFFSRKVKVKEKNLKFKRYFGKLVMARANRVEFEMNSILQFKSVIRVYCDIWTLVKDETLLCMEDEREEEAKSFDKYSVGTFKNNVLVGHVPKANLLFLKI